MGTGSLPRKTYCSCNFGSSFWSTGYGSFYSGGCSWPSEYRLFWCLSVVVYNWFTH
ncbi:Catalase-peroxidase [Bienertia sinuspersici]